MYFGIRLYRIPASNLTRFFCSLRNISTKSYDFLMEKFWTAIRSILVSLLRTYFQRENQFFY
ncbi:hypothetical protein BpHYR1_024144 [Brachionus plicatilis]|uniref:Uncharacterized protein n=1 Tax=Brachionus plicatilis TaxID=10195 RepID=A0A3M7TAA6_BRAPC|nr:hypothetical protein BpHYR1_024144 [Brachionus plicatilis]